jgi:methylglutaconyl-CoA hydratase
MIRELAGLIPTLETDERIQMVRLSSTGKNFCAGADLNWMRDGLKQSREQLISESRELADLFWSMHNSRLIIVTAIRGRAMGGALGLIAASDIVLAEETAVLAFSEVRLGLIPATIAPFALQKMGYSRCLELMASGRSFTAGMAVQYGLIHHLCEEGALEKTTEDLLATLLANGPEAMQSVKSLLNKLEEGMPLREARKLTTELIAEHRISAEGQEGMNAFFEKRDPNWYGAT